jgi:hypothetical protein
MVAPVLLAPLATFQAPALLTTLSQKKLLAHKLLKEALYVTKTLVNAPFHQGREIIAIVPLENGAFCTVFSENFHKL